jgi:hypothetical protein
MRLTSGVFALLLMAACGQAPPVAGPGEVASSVRMGVPGSESPLPITALTFPCRLPFINNVYPGQWQGGFIDFPSATWTADPSSPPNPGYYDRAVSRWLPVGRNAVAPDGRHYTYITGGVIPTPAQPRLHVVEAATGAERVLALALSDQLPYGVEDFAADGIYIGSGWEGTTFGTWRVDPANGNITDLGKQLHFPDDGTGRAWVSIFDSRDPNPAPNAMGGDPMSNEIGRRDLKTGAVEIWFYHPGFNVSLAGAFIEGGLLVWVERPWDGHHEYWLVTAPGKSRLIAYIDGGGGLADSHGIWLRSTNGLYLVARDGSVKRVSNLQGEPGNGCI